MQGHSGWKDWWSANLFVANLSLDTELERRGFSDLKSGSQWLTPAGSVPQFSYIVNKLTQVHSLIEASVAIRSVDLE